MIFRYLSEIYDPYDFIPEEKQEITKCAFKPMFEKNPETLRLFILDHIPVSCIPNEYYKEAYSLHSIVSCFEALSMNPEDSQLTLENGYRTFLYNSLYEMIMVGGMTPSVKFMEALPVDDVAGAIKAFQEGLLLYRFFDNLGRVFFDESMKLANLRRVAYLKEDIPLSYFYLILEKDNILRRARADELELVISTRTKAIILEALDKIGVTGINKTATKKQLIKELLDKPNMIHKDVMDTFFTLSDNFQEFKEWMLDQVAYFKLFRLFFEPVRTAMYHFPTVMKELIRNNEDYTTAKKLGKLYFAILNSNEFVTVLGDDLGEAAVKVQMKKINHYFSN